MSDTMTTAAASWDETMLLLQQGSRECGMLMLELANVESTRGELGRDQLWCMGRGGRSRRHERFMWRYWTRRAR